MSSAELIVFSPGAVHGVLTGLAGEFTRTTGQPVRLVGGTSGSVVDRIMAGDAADVAISTSDGIASLVQAGRIIGTSVKEIGRMRVGVGVRSGAALPDIATVDAFKSALRMAQSITFADPAHGGQSGIHAAKIIEALGIAGELSGKLRLFPGAAKCLAAVAAGTVELAIAQISAIVTSPGVALAGPLPDEIQNVESFSIGVHSRGSVNAAAKNFCEFVVSSAAKLRFREVGFDVA